MIKTIEEAIAKLNESNHWGRDDWHLVDNGCTMQRLVASDSAPPRNYDAWEALTLARALNCDYGPAA